MNKCQLISELSREGYRQKQKKQKAILQLLILISLHYADAFLWLRNQWFKIYGDYTDMQKNVAYYIYQLLVKKLSNFLYIFLIKNIY